jgi:hypothetical protein
VFEFVEDSPQALLVWRFVVVLQELSGPASTGGLALVDDEALAWGGVSVPA